MMDNMKKMNTSNKNKQIKNKQIKYKDAIVEKPSQDNSKDNICWACSKQSKNMYVCLKEDNESFNICNDCKTSNLVNKLIPCVKCEKFFKIDFTRLTVGTKIKYGRCAFVYCNSCLKFANSKNCPDFGYIWNYLSAIVPDDELGDDISNVRVL